MIKTRSNTLKGAYSVYKCELYSESLSRVQSFTDDEFYIFK